MADGEDDAHDDDDDEPAANVTGGKRKREVQQLAKKNSETAGSVVGSEVRQGVAEAQRGSYPALQQIQKREDAEAEIARTKYVKAQCVVDPGATGEEIDPEARINIRIPIGCKLQPLRDIILTELAPEGCVRYYLKRFSRSPVEKFSDKSSIKSDAAMQSITASKSDQVDLQLHLESFRMRLRRFLSEEEEAQCIEAIRKSLKSSCCGAIGVDATNYKGAEYILKAKFTAKAGVSKWEASVTGTVKAAGWQKPREFHGTAKLKAAGTDSFSVEGKSFEVGGRPSGNARAAA